MFERGTGRTTRMLLHAIRLKREGRPVYVISADISQARVLFNMLCDMLPEDVNRSNSALEIYGIKIKTSDVPWQFNWRTLSIRGVEKDCVVLVDHFAIESHFALMLDMLTAYDNV